MSIPKKIKEKLSALAANKGSPAMFMSGAEACYAEISSMPQKCNAGHERWPITLWDCPECANKIRSQLATLKGENERLRDALEFYADKNNWLRDKNGWRHDMIIEDLDDETLTNWEGRFSGKRARAALNATSVSEVKE